MKKEHGWWLPNHEEHLQGIMKHEIKTPVIEGRAAYQHRKLDACMEHIRNTRRTAIDVGGHIGLWSFYLATIFNKVEAFEPVSLHRICFQMNTEHRRNIELHPFALGNKEEEVQMMTQIGSSGNSLVSNSSGNQNQEGFEFQEDKVEMKLGDSFSFRHVDFIKIDCEGYEENVLRGFTKTIKRWKPTIIVEQKKGWPQEHGLEQLGAVKFLEDEHGYSMIREYSGDYILSSKLS